MLVGGLDHFLLFHILGIITPTDFHIFQRGSNQQPDVHLFSWMFIIPPMPPAPTVCDDL